MENKRSYPHLSEDVAKAADQIHIGSLYRHYKNQHLYMAIGFGILEATNEVAVLYRPQDEGSNLTFVRPASAWLEDVEYDGQVVKRFTKVG